MNLPQKYYLEHMFENTGYRANWLPARPFRIGDIGKLENGLFTLYTMLEQQNINCKIRESISELDLDYSSANSVNIDVGTSTGNVLNLTLSVPAEVRVENNFRKSNGILFQMTAAKKKVIENLSEIETEVFHRYRFGTWPKEWVVISEIVSTDHATITISTSSNNKIELGCNAQIGFAKDKLANPNLNLMLISEKGSSTKIFGANNLTLFYQVKGIYEPFLRKPQFMKRTDVTNEIEVSAVKDLKFDPREL